MSGGFGGIPPNMPPHDCNELNLANHELSGSSLGRIPPNPPVDTERPPAFLKSSSVDLRETP